MKDTLLHLYEGKGATVEERELDMPLYEPLVDPGKPEHYIADKQLSAAVNVALALGQPLFVTGEPGTGKTQLADSVAHELGLVKLDFNAKTTSTARDLFYQYDALRRFQDAQIEDHEAGQKIDLNPENYITYQALGLAILLSKPPEEANRHLPEKYRNKGPTRTVVLIDEIDKAPRDLPNDVLNEVERMTFTLKETGQTFTADPRYRPILIITSNSEKNLPNAFLRRCVYYHVPFPSEKQLKAIVNRRFADHPGFTAAFVDEAVEHFLQIRTMSLKKKPATGEFLPWLGLLQSLKLDTFDAKSMNEGQREALAISYSILAKNNDDLKKLCRRVLPTEES